MTQQLRPGLEESLAEMCRSLEQGEVTASQLVDHYLQRIDDPAGEGRRSFLNVCHDRARSEAGEIDRRRAEGHPVGPFAGIPIAVKDLFDVEGETTPAGARVLAQNPPAEADATCVARLRQAGMIIVGRTNMTEFAYSGLGLNPHYDTPRSIWRREEGRIPGGSSAGSAVAVADRQAVAGLGTDTGGSCRIPAAFSNIVGYKPTARVVPLDGVVPLAPSLDSVGPLAESAITCGAVHRLLAGERPSRVRAALDEHAAGSVEPAGVRLALLNTMVLDGLDSEVEDAFERALSVLSAAGVEVVEQGLPKLDDLASVNSNGGLAAAEAYRWHEDLLGQAADQYDPRVRIRIEAGSAVTDTALAAVTEYRADLISSFAGASDGFDAWVLPTVAILPPRMSDFPAFDGGTDDFYRQANLAVLRNTSVGNMLDSCAISLPLCHSNDRAEAPPVGLMLMAPGMADNRLLAIAEALEPICRQVAS